MVVEEVSAAIQTRGGCSFGPTIAHADKDASVAEGGGTPKQQAAMWKQLLGVVERLRRRGSAAVSDGSWAGDIPSQTSWLHDMINNSLVAPLECNVNG